jgi:5'-3' exonuclease
MTYCKRIEKLQKQLDELKGTCKCKESCNKKITDCLTKKEVENFDVEDLKKFVSKNKISQNKNEKLVKEAYVKLVWKYLEEYYLTDATDSETDSETDSDSDSESESEYETETESETDD